MKALTESPWKQRVFFFLAGAFFAIGCGAAKFFYMIAIADGNSDSPYDWFKGVAWFAGWLPWVVCVALLVLRFLKGPHIRVGFYFFGTVAPIALLIGWLFLRMPIENIIHCRNFDTELWRNQEALEYNIMWPPRLCMVDDLMASGKLEGLTETQVLELLGPSFDMRSPFGAAYCDLIYPLGPARRILRLDSEWLCITFGDNDQVNRYWLAMD